MNKQHKPWGLPLDSERRTLDFIVQTLGGVETPKENLVEGRIYLIPLNNRGDFQIGIYSSSGSKAVEACVKFNGSTKIGECSQSNMPLKTDYVFPIYHIRKDAALPPKLRAMLGYKI